MISRINAYNPVFKANRNYLTTTRRKPVTPDVFNYLANQWADQDLLCEGDCLIILPKGRISEAAKYDKKIAATYKKTNLSKNGFAVSVMDADGRIHTDALQYFDPKVITMLKLTNAIRNNQNYYIPVELIEY